VPTLKIEVEDLAPGMYVTELDRAWLDTPFPTQGFPINGDKDLAELRSLCKFVYIDPERAAPALKGTNRRKSAGPEALMAESATVHTDALAMEQEMASAKEAHSKVTAAIQEYLEAARLGKKVDLPSIERSIATLVSSILRNPDAMMWLLRFKKHGDYLYSHAVNSSILGAAFGRHLGLPKRDLEHLALGAALFDAGKTKLPKELLEKPGRLTAEEFELVKGHVQNGAQLLQKSGELPGPVLELIEAHHERFNGSGYPHGLSGGKIPLFGRMIAIVDCYDAITTDRPYARAISGHEAIRRLYDWRDSDFQDELVEQFIQTLGVYPTGTLVELSTGEVGIIISQNRIRRLRPRVMVVLDTNKVSYDAAPIVDLLEETKDKDGNPLDIVATLEPGSYGVRPDEFYL